MRAAADGLGIVRLFPNFFSEEIHRLGLQHVLPSYQSSPITVYAITPGGRLTPPKVRVLLDAIGTTL
ncbi:hypothetical protein LMG3441_00714 [Achromobacter kerstersii]|uniref:LysR substrate-binding domain-containing protein n=1 Tax=Achromobacter kerstersii TaxID=1353890 RepID=A0A6S6Z946_9BURK|nr:hypothetical protein LMG3441_00714 [Achromobacter kerstersii]